MVRVCLKPPGVVEVEEDGKKKTLELKQREFRIHNVSTQHRYSPFII